MLVKEGGKEEINKDELEKLELIQNEVGIISIFEDNLGSIYKSNLYTENDDLSLFRN